MNNNSEIFPKRRRLCKNWFGNGEIGNKIQKFISITDLSMFNYN